MDLKDSTLLAIIKRMDAMEERIMKRIDVLWDFRLKILASVAVLSFVGSSFVTFAFALYKELNRGR